MKKKRTVIAFLLATMFMSMPLFSEARGASEPVSFEGSSEYNQYVGVGRVRTRRRRQVRRRRRVRRHMRRQVRRQERRRVRRRVRSGHDH